jgi:cell wall-associated NlpC family hydrolase
MANDLQMIAEELLGLPYAEGGRGPDVFDCYGLVREFHRRRGLSLPDGRDEEAIADFFVRVERPDPGDVIKLHKGQCLGHVGIFLRDGVLNMTERGSKLIHHRHLVGKIEGYYRHRDLC